MHKDFDSWNKIKKDLDQLTKKFFFKEGEIWWISVGLNIARETCGKGLIFRRPVLILKKLASDTFIGIPLSTKRKVGTWFTDITLNNEKRYALLY